MDYLEHIPTILASIVGLAGVAYLFGVIIFFGLSYLETRATWDYHPKFAFLEAGALFITTLVVLLGLAILISVYKLPNPATTSFWHLFWFSIGSLIILISLIAIYNFVIPQKGYHWWQIWPWYILGFSMLVVVLLLMVHEARFVFASRPWDSYDIAKTAILGVLAIANLLLLSPVWGVMFDGPFLEYDPIELRFLNGAKVRSKLIQDTPQDYVCWDENEEQVVFYPKALIKRALVEK